MRSPDRHLKLVMQGKDAGLLDPQLFAEKNRLRVVMDSENLTWSFKYDRGVVPPQLKGKFSNFKTAKQHAENYFKTKNVKITEVID